MSASKQQTDQHGLYHEAQRRASLAQPIQRYSNPSSLLLSAPNNVIFELFGTVVKEISSEKLLDFITHFLSDYLEQNWSNKIIQRAIKRLKREQAVDIKAGLTNIPLIKYSTRSLSSSASESIKKKQNSATGESSEKSQAGRNKQKSPPLNYVDSIEANKQKAIKQIYEHIMWRIRTENVTQITSLLVKLALDDGYKRAKLRAEVYDDVPANFEQWRSKLLIKLYAFGDAPATDQKLILSSTNKGDLTKWMANYIDGSDKRQNPDLIRKLASALRDRTKNCFYLTHDINDAIRSLQTGAIRLVLLVDRVKQYEPLDLIANFQSTVEPLIKSGKLYIINSLDVIKLAPDPTSESCC